jgi:predicted DsbA family dithiol-disulfide isomerase
MNVVEVFADVCCPFTHVGLRRLVQRRREIDSHLVLRVRSWPLELVNGAPLDAALIAAEVEELRLQVAPDLFAGFEPSRFPPTSLPALGLAAAAYQHDLASGERLSLLLRDALFEHGHDISQPDELEELATAAGLPGLAVAGQAVVDDWTEGRQRGVVGSPHFFVGQSDFFCPAMRIERIDGHLRIARDRAGFEEFIERCTRP